MNDQARMAQEEQRSENVDSRKTYLIVEGNPSGHRLNYVAILAREVLARGARLTFCFTSEVDQSEESRMFLSSLGPIPRVVIDRMNLSAIGDVARNLSIDSVVIPDGDPFVYKLAWSRNWTATNAISLLVMRETAQPKSRWSIASFARTMSKQALLNVAARRKRVRVVRLRPANWQGASRHRVALDPVQLDQSISEQSIRVQFGLEDATFWFAVLGSVSRRKNIDSILRALEQCGTSAGLIVAGKCDEFTRVALHERSNTNPVVIHDRLLTVEELDGLVRTVDCVLLAHSNEGPSGLFGKASAAGTRILASGALSLKQDVKRSPQNAAWVPLQVEALAEGMRRSQASPKRASTVQFSLQRFTDPLL